MVAASSKETSEPLNAHHSSLPYLLLLLATLVLSNEAVWTLQPLRIFKLHYLLEKYYPIAYHIIAFLTHLDRLSTVVLRCIILITNPFVLPNIIERRIHWRIFNCGSWYMRYEVLVLFMLSFCIVPSFRFLNREVMKTLKLGGNHFNLIAQFNGKISCLVPGYVASKLPWIVDILQKVIP